MSDESINIVFTITTLDCTIFDEKGQRIPLAGEWTLSFGEPEKLS